MDPGDVERLQALWHARSRRRRPRPSDGCTSGFALEQLVEHEGAQLVRTQLGRASPLKALPMGVRMVSTITAFGHLRISLSQVTGGGILRGRGSRGRARMPPMPDFPAPPRVPPSRRSSFALAAPEATGTKEAHRLRGKDQGATEGRGRRQGRPTRRKRRPRRPPSRRPRRRPRATKIGGDRKTARRIRTRNPTSRSAWRACRAGWRRIEPQGRGV